MVEVIVSQLHDFNIIHMTEQLFIWYSLCGVCVCVYTLWLDITLICKLSGFLNHFLSTSLVSSINQILFFFFVSKRLKVFFVAPFTQS